MKKKLYISETDKKFLGVCGGVGEYLDVDSTIIRLVALALIFFPPFPGLIAYFAMYLVIPKQPI